MPTTPISGKLVDGVFRRVLAQDLTPELSARLSAAGLDLSQSVQAEYPREIWYRGIELVAAGLYPQLGGPEQLRRLGRHVIEALQTRNILRGPWLSMVKFLGPKRAMRQAADHSERFSPVKLEVHERAGRHVEIHVEEDRQLEFLAGLLEGLVGALGGKSPRVVVQSTNGAHVVLSAVWT